MAGCGRYLSVYWIVACNTHTYHAEERWTARLIYIEKGAADLTIFVLASGLHLLGNLYVEGIVLSDIYRCDGCWFHHFNNHHLTGESEMENLGTFIWYWRSSRRRVCHLLPAGSQSNRFVCCRFIFLGTYGLFPYRAQSTHTCANPGRIFGRFSGSVPFRYFLLKLNNNINYCKSAFCFFALKMESIWLHKTN